MGLFNRFFGDPNNKEVSRFQSIVDEVNNFESELESLNDDQLRSAAQKLRTDISTPAADIIRSSNDINDRADRNKDRKHRLNQLLEPHEAYAFALAREAAKRTIGLRHYDVQV